MPASFGLAGEAWSAALAGVLQRSCERLVILATSREGLGIEGERLVQVLWLGLPGAGAGLDTTVGTEAVRLFAERAAAVKPGFRSSWAWGTAPAQGKALGVAYVVDER